MAAPDPTLIATYLTGVAVVVGVLGAVIPILPGVGLQLIAIAGWTFFVREPAAYVALLWAVLVMAVGTWWQWRHPRDRADGPDSRMMMCCGVGAILGGILVPVVGVIGGLCAGVVVDQRLRGIPLKQACSRIPTAVRMLMRYKILELGQAICIGVGWEIAVLIIFQGKVV